MAPQRPDAADRPAATDAGDVTGPGQDSPRHPAQAIDPSPESRPDAASQGAPPRGAALQELLTPAPQPRSPSLASTLVGRLSAAKAWSRALASASVTRLRSRTSRPGRDDPEAQNAREERQGLRNMTDRASRATLSGLNGLADRGRDRALRPMLAALRERRTLLLESFHYAVILSLLVCVSIEVHGFIFTPPLAGGQQSLRALLWYTALLLAYLGLTMTWTPLYAWLSGRMSGRMSRHRAANRAAPREHEANMLLWCDRGTPDALQPEGPGVGDTGHPDVSPPSDTVAMAAVRTETDPTAALVASADPDASERVDLAESTQKSAEPCAAGNAGESGTPETSRAPSDGLPGAAGVEAAGEGTIEGPRRTTPDVLRDMLDRAPFLARAPRTSKRGRLGTAARRRRVNRAFLYGVRARLRHVGAATDAAKRQLPESRQPK